MTPEHNDKLEAGRELDALVAKKVMGLFVIPTCDGFKGPFIAETPETSGLFGRPKFVEPFLLPGYSTSISAAWEVVEKLNIPWVWALSNYHNEWEVELTRIDIDHQGVHAHASTAPLAICRAALKAMEVK